MELYDKFLRWTEHGHSSVKFSKIYNFWSVSEFGSEKPQTRLYASTALADLPFKDMDTNACLYTECPIVAQEEQNWEYHLFVAEKYPTGKRTVKLKFWDNDKGANKKDECCFTFDIKIVSKWTFHDTHGHNTDRYNNILKINNILYNTIAE